MMRSLGYKLLGILLIGMVTACSPVPSDIRDICRQGVLFNSFLAYQAANSLASFGKDSATKDSFIESIKQAREDVKKWDFSRAYRTDGKSFSDWKRNEGPIEIVVPHREKDNALTVSCKITKGDKGEYLFSYPSLIFGNDKMYAGKTPDEIIVLLTSTDLDAILLKEKEQENALRSDVEKQAASEREATRHRVIEMGIKNAKTDVWNELLRTHHFNEMQIVRDKYGPIEKELDDIGVSLLHSPEQHNATVSTIQDESDTTKRCKAMIYKGARDRVRVEKANLDKWFNGNQKELTHKQRLEYEVAKEQLDIIDRSLK